MKKFLIAAAIGTILVMITCGLSCKRSNTASEIAEEQKLIDPKSDILPPGSLGVVSNPDDIRPSTDPTPATNDAEGPRNNDSYTWDDKTPLSEIDRVKIDELVREKAKGFKQQPEQFRLLFRQLGDGTKIYRMLGTFVIVSPNKEEVFLPDEL